MNNKKLKEAYLEILTNHAPENSEKWWANWLDPKQKPKKISGLFLPSISGQYEASKTKIMLVGAETAGWDPLLERNEFGQALTANGEPATRLTYESLEDYVDKTMFRHSQVFSNGLAAKNSKGKTFYNYLRELDKELAPIGAGFESAGWVWSNLHCFDWNGASPIRNKSCYQNFIKPVSEKLLNKQIEILKPDFIVFLSGIFAAKTRNDFFEERVTKLPEQNHQFSTKYLWEFLMDNAQHCIRTHHPSARNPEAQRALSESRKMLKRLIEKHA